MCRRADQPTRPDRSDREDPIYEDEVDDAPPPPLHLSSPVVLPPSVVAQVHDHVVSSAQNLLVYNVVSQAEGAQSPPMVSLHQNVQSRLLCIAAVLDMLADYVPVPLHLRLAAGTAYTLMRGGGLLLRHGLVCVHCECILEVYVLHDFVSKRLPQFAAMVHTWQSTTQEDDVVSLDSLGDVDLVDVHDVVQAALMWIQRTLEPEVSLHEQVGAVNAQLEAVKQLEPQTGVPEPCFEPLNHTCVPLYSQGVVVE